MNAQIPYDTRGRELTDGPRFPGGFSEYVNIFSLVFCSGCFCILRAYPVASCLHSGPVWHALTEKGCDDIRESPLKSCISSLISHIYLYLVSHVYRLKEDQTWLLTRGLQRSLFISSSQTRPSIINAATYIQIITIISVITLL